MFTDVAFLVNRPAVVRPHPSLALVPVYREIGH
jgi:hypothetical protein